MEFPKQLMNQLKSAFSVAPEDQLENQAVTENPRSCNGIWYEVRVGKKISQNQESEEAERSNMVEKAPNHPPTSEMMLDSIKSLKRRKGATLEDICKRMEDTYDVNVKNLKFYITRYLNSAVEKGLLVKAGTTGDKNKFKLRKTRNSAKKTQNHPPTSEMVLDSIKSLKVRKGASLEDVCKHMEDTYDVNVRKLKPVISRCLNSAVTKGLLANAEKTGEKKRFKLQKTGNTVPKTQNP